MKYIFTEDYYFLNKVMHKKGETISEETLCERLKCEKQSLESFIKISSLNNKIKRL